MDVNYTAILFSGIAAMILGMLWYSPMLFGGPYMRVMGWNPKDTKKKERMMQDMGLIYFITFCAALATAYCIGLLMPLLMVDTLDGAFRIAFLLWLGFMLPVALGSSLFSGKMGSDKWTLLGITAGHYLIGIMLTASIMFSVR